MKKILFPAIAASLLATSAFAADLPRRGGAIAPAPAMPVFVSMNWTGFYVGAQLGYSWDSQKVCEFNAAGALTASGCRKPGADGMVGGLHAGYNYQFGQIVMGLEGDIEATSKKGRVAPWPVAGTSYAAKTDWQGSLRGRVGYAFDRALLYVTGGVAFANAKHTYVDAVVPVSVRTDSTRVGWTLGGGLEYAITNNWTARAEYRYTSFGNKTDVMPAAGAGAFSGFRYKNDNTDHTVRVGVSYLFNMGSSPVVAKF